MEIFEIFLVIVGVAMASFSIGLIIYAVIMVISRDKDRHYDKWREGLKKEKANRKEEK